MITAVLASIALAVWIYLLAARGTFWLCRERDDWTSAELPVWPRVTAVVPARNEADGIAASIGSLLKQDYPGPWTVILVDDDSSDGTAEIARRAAPAAAAGLRQADRFVAGARPGDRILRQAMKPPPSTASPS